MSPVWADYGAARTLIPILDATVDALWPYALTTALVLFVYTAIDRLTKGWTKKRGLFALVIILFGLIYTGFHPIKSLEYWLLSGALWGIILLLAYLFVFRYHLALVPIALVVPIMFGEVKQIVFSAFPAAVFGSVLAIILIGALSIYWYKKLLSDV